MNLSIRQKLLSDLADIANTHSKNMAIVRLFDSIWGGSFCGPAKSLAERMIELLDTLNDREKKVLIARFGIEDGRIRTLEEVGRAFGVTRERIREIEAKAIRRLRHPSRIAFFLDRKKCVQWVKDTG
jgi:hypothetical protein